MAFTENKQQITNYLVSLSDKKNEIEKKVKVDPNAQKTLKTIDLCMDILREIISQESSLVFYDQKSSIIMGKYSGELFKIITTEKTDDVTLYGLASFLSLIVREVYLSCSEADKILVKSNYEKVIVEVNNYMHATKRDYFWNILPLEVYEKNIYSYKEIVDSENKKIRENLESEVTPMSRPVNKIILGDNYLPCLLVNNTAKVHLGGGFIR